MTPKLRAVIYAVVAGALGVAVVVGRITADQSAAVLAVVDAVLNLVTAAALVVAARHVTPDSWASLRLALYTVAAVVVGGAGVFGLAWDGDAVLAIVNEALNVVGVVLLFLASAKVPAAAPRRAIEDDPAAG